ncbi:MAG: M20/M25/M40 family metallo-hydrolase [Chloroflexota bacterium]|nr:M20/M25/M40 family metallo-hydrolase [Chloroflexota bacterium]
MTEINSYIDDHLEESIALLGDYVKLPSVSAQKQAIPETAAFVKTMLESLGATADVLEKETSGHPVVVGELQGDSPYTLLMYNHYDVQPPEPLELWKSPPFEMTRYEDKAFGRGISDNKAHLVSRLLAIRAVREAHGGKLPITIKFLIEGDEEIGSAKLLEFVQRYHERLSADVALSEGGGINSAGRPIISLGVRGVLHVELRARTALSDLHSSMGNVVPNAAWRLVWALAAIKDPDDNVLIPGFYDAVRPPTPEEDALLRAVPSEEDTVLTSLGLREFIGGARGYDYQRRIAFWPACTIDGMGGGYQGPGSKTVIPAEASAKIDFRLVPDQTPDDITSKLRKHLDAQGFSEIEVTAEEGEFPARSDATHPFVGVVAGSAREVYGEEPIVLPNAAGTQPLYPMMHALGVPFASAGLSYFAGRAHAPNENIRIADFIAGTRHVAAIIQRLPVLARSHAD